MSKLQPKKRTLIWTISGALAMLSVLPLMSVCNEDGPCAVFGVFTVLGFVGIVLSAMVTNLHDPNLVLAIFFNWMLFALTAIGITKLRKRFKKEPLLEE